jgi:hypothetical protein
LSIFIHCPFIYSRRRDETAAASGGFPQASTRFFGPFGGNNNCGYGYNQPPPYGYQASYYQPRPPPAYF